MVSYLIYLKEKILISNRSACSSSGLFLVKSDKFDFFIRYYPLFLMEILKKLIIFIMNDIEEGPSYSLQPS